MRSIKTKILFITYIIIGTSAVVAARALDGVVRINSSWIRRRQVARALTRV